jgi:hypothetical protein
MAFEKCASGGSEDGKISKDEARQMMKEISDYIPQARQKLGGSASEASVLQEAARMAHNQAEAAAAIERRNQLMNLNKRKARLEYQKTFSPKKMYDAIASQIRGTNTPGDMRLMSGQAISRMKHAEYAVAMAQELERAGLVKFLNDERNELALAQELREQNLPEGVRQEGVSGNDAAVKASKIISRYLNLAREELNSEGAWIGDLDGYIAHQSHDPAQMMRGGRSAVKPLEGMAAKERWLKFVKPMLDDRTFLGVADKNKFLDGVYNALVSGVHLSAEGGTGLKDPAFSGPGNKAKKLSQGRVLHFKDAASDIAYQAEYGEKRLNDRIFRTLQNSARNYALLKIWGTNPRAEFENDIRRLSEAHRDTAPDAVAAFQKKTQALKNRMDFLDGTASRPQNELAATVMQNVRSIEAMSKLGNVMFTHLSVGATKAAELRHHGVGHFERFAHFFKSFADGMTPAERVQFGRDLLAETEGAQGSILSRFDPTDDMPGTASTIQNAYYRMTGLNWLYGIQRQGLIFKLSANLADNAGRAFDALHPLLQNKLKGYGIHSAEWELLRKAEHQKTSHGMAYFTPKAAESVTDEALRGYLGETVDMQGVGTKNPTSTAAQAAKIEAARKDLALKLHAYFSDSADRGMITPGVEERAFWLGNSKRGSLAGEAARSFSQFKLWPTALVTQAIARDLYATPNWKSAAGGIMSMAVACTMYGYARMVAVDLLSGKTPRSPTDPATIMAAVMKGGGFGILGDFFFGEATRNGNSPLVTELGPIASDLESLLKIYNTAKQDALEGAKHPLLPEVVRFGLDHIPGVNLWFLRSAINYLFLWRIYETMSPGWAARHEQRVKKETDQNFWLRPSKVKPL